MQNGLGAETEGAGTVLKSAAERWKGVKGLRSTGFYEYVKRNRAIR